MAAQGKIIPFRDAKRNATRRSLDASSKVRAQDVAAKAMEAEAVEAPEVKASEARASVKASDRVSAKAAAKASGKSSARRRYQRKSPSVRRTDWRDLLNKFLARPALVTAATFLAVLLVAGIFMYPAARSWYQAMRENQRLDAEYALILERNQALMEESERLDTPEGIKQEAREELGWVEPGENVVIVYGSDITHDDDVYADVVSGAVKPPVTWWSPFFDFFFGVE